MSVLVMSLISTLTLSSWETLNFSASLELIIRVQVKEGGGLGCNRNKVNRLLQCSTTKTV